MACRCNARFFKRETFRQLRDNIATDKRLSSVPLCYRYPDGKLEVLSGNHRVQALESDMREQKDFLRQIEDCAHMNSRNFSRLALLVSDMNRQLCKPEPKAAATPISETRDNCRIIHFKSAQNQ